MKKKNLLWYFLAVIAVFIVKVYYRTADSDALKWILAPTTWWVRTLAAYLLNIPRRWDISVMLTALSLRPPVQGCAFCCLCLS